MVGAPHDTRSDADGRAIGVDPHGHRHGRSGPVAYWHVDGAAESLAALVAAGAETVQDPTDVGGDLVGPRGAR